MSRIVRVAVWGLCASILLTTLAARAAPPVILHLRLDGIINPIKVRYVKESLERARAERASIVLISIDTPGGLVSSMQDIVAAITNSPLPVVGLVEPRTAQATSAGAFILLATDVAAMLPDTRMGAAHPVGSGGNLDGAMEKKATNSLVSLAKSLASRRGRPENIAEAIVRDSTSYTAQEAKKEGVVELVVSGVDDLLSRLDGRVLPFADRKVTLSTRGAALLNLPLSRANRLLDRIADPTLASTLLTIGVLGILYELSAPGVGMGGIVGVTCLLLAFLGMSVLPINLVGFCLLAAGFAAIALEATTPTHGLVGAGGVLALILGALTLVDESSYFGALQKVDWRLFAPIVGALAAGFLGLATIARRALRAAPRTGIESLRGARGMVKESLMRSGDGFTGTVFVDGARWQAFSKSEIMEGEPIDVVEVHVRPTRLEVKRARVGDT